MPTSAFTTGRPEPSGRRAGHAQQDAHREYSYVYRDQDKDYSFQLARAPEMQVPDTRPPLHVVPPAPPRVQFADNPTTYSLSSDWDELSPQVTRHIHREDPQPSHEYDEEKQSTWESQDDTEYVHAEKIHRYHTVDRTPATSDVAQNVIKDNMVRCDISQTTDITLHAHMETGKDISTELDNFSRLHRTGCFMSARKRFEKTLSKHVDNAYIYVQYAHLLYESGDYRALNALKPPPEMRPHQFQALARNLSSLKRASLLHTTEAETREEYAYDFYTSRSQYVKSENKCSSTELQSVLLSLRNLGNSARYEDGIDRDVLKRAFSVIPYSELSQQGQVWDCRDIFVSLAQCAGSMEHIPWVYGAKGYIGLLDRATSRWDLASTDVSTLLAALDIAEAILFTGYAEKDTFQRLLQRVTNLISSLLQADPALVASRQYIRWTLAKVLCEVHGKESMWGFDDSQKNPGVFICQPQTLAPPIYLPRRLEKPSATARVIRQDLVPFLRTALDAARALGDHETEVMCLQALIHQTEDPTSFYDDLIRLQQATQDEQGCLATYLSKYVFCTNVESRDALKQDILALDYSDNYPSMLLWARAMILRALSATRTESYQHLRAALAVDFTHVPDRYRAFEDVVYWEQRVRAERRISSLPRQKKDDATMGAQETDKDTKNNEKSPTRFGRDPHRRIKRDSTTRDPRRSVIESRRSNEAYRRYISPESSSDSDEGTSRQRRTHSAPTLNRATEGGAVDKEISASTPYHEPHIDKGLTAVGAAFSKVDLRSMYDRLITYPGYGLVLTPGGWKDMFGDKKKAKKLRPNGTVKELPSAPKGTISPNQEKTESGSRFEGDGLQDSAPKPSGWDFGKYSITSPSAWNIDVNSERAQGGVNGTPDLTEKKKKRKGLGGLDFDFGLDSSSNGRITASKDDAPSVSTTTQNGRLSSSEVKPQVDVDDWGFGSSWKKSKTKKKKGRIALWQPDPILEPTITSTVEQETEIPRIKRAATVESDPEIESRMNKSLPRDGEDTMVEVLGGQAVEESEIRGEYTSSPKSPEKGDSSTERAVDGENDDEEDDMVDFYD
ncbi:hypothetical protein ACN47E_008229 [Coniothyrium glycines]